MASRSSTLVTILAAVVVIGSIPLLAMNPASCEKQLRGAAAGPTISPDGKAISIKINDRTFKLDLALDNDTRIKGLGQRESIPDDGGMFFVFPDDQVRVQGFIMRDCTFPIDILYLDGSGRILTQHTMKVEPPRGEGEGKPGLANNTDAENLKYESRLPQYSSRFPSQFVLEFKGGALEPLKLKEGAKVEFDRDELKKRAK
ncbi:MAG: DUF192 domain-containing protein [Phycisphaerales bacterium]